MNLTFRVSVKIPTMRKILIIL